MAWQRMAIRRVAGGLTLAGIVFAVLFVMSLEDAVSIRGSRCEIGYGSGLLTGTFALGTHRLIPIWSDLHAPLLRRPLFEPSWWFQYRHDPGLFVIVSAPLWLLSLAVVPGAFLLYRTRGPGRIRRMSEFLARLRHASRLGQALLWVGVVLIGGMLIRSAVGVQIGRGWAVSVGSGTIAVSMNTPTAGTGLGLWRYPYGIQRPKQVGPFVLFHPRPRVWWPDVSLGAARFSDWPGWTFEDSVGIPLWLLGVVIGAVGALMCWRTYSVAGQCVRCRYSLAGLPPGAACPECGNTGVTP
jgi:hypothetical protein